MKQLDLNFDLQEATELQIDFWQKAYLWVAIDVMIWVRNVCERVYFSGT